MKNYDIERFDYVPTLDYNNECIPYHAAHNMDKFMRFILNKSREIYKDYTVLPGNLASRNTSTYTMMGYGVDAEHLALLAEGSHITASTNSCRHTLGSIIKLETEPSNYSFDKR